MQRSFYAILFLLSAFAFTSCQKSGDVVATQQDIEGTWVVTGITSDRAYDFNGDGYTETDIYGSYNSCGRDIVAVFQSGGYGQMRQGCNANWQNINWQLTNNNRNLDIALPNDDLNLALQQFDNYTIRGVDQVQINGNYFNVTYTFQRR
jgi:hypothetical protein